MEQTPEIKNNPKETIYFVIAIAIVCLAILIYVWHGICSNNLEVIANYPNFSYNNTVRGFV
jgi:hypothetical protein